MPHVLVVLIRRLRLALYTLMTRPPSEMKPDIRFFRLGIPFVMKCTRRTFSTEAHALTFLKSTGLDLPVPRVIDTFVLGGSTYTVMTLIRGIPLVDAFRGGPGIEIPLNAEHYQCIANAIRDVLLQLWTITQTAEDEGRVMLSASGHGLPDPAQFFDEYGDPQPSILDLYYYMTPQFDRFGRPEWTREHLLADQPLPMAAVMADQVSWVHADLKMQNIMVDAKTGEFRGIVDWEDSGWRPRHWQLFCLRSYGPVMIPPLADCFRRMRFDEKTEAAYDAMFKLLEKVPT